MSTLRHCALWARKLFLQRQANKIRARFYRGEADHAAIERYLKGFGQLNSATVRFFDHQCHAASAYYSSPFSRDDAVVVVTIDGFGDGYFSKVFQCQQDTMTLISGSQTSRIVGATTELKFLVWGLYMQISPKQWVSRSIVRRKG